MSSRHKVKRRGLTDHVPLAAVRLVAGCVVQVLWCWCQWSAGGRLLGLFRGSQGPPAQVISPMHHCTLGLQLPVKERSWKAPVAAIMKEWNGVVLVVTDIVWWTE